MQDTYSTYEVSQITGLHVVNICSWIRHGILKPAHRGKRGAGNGSHFSRQQVIALSLVGALTVTVGCTARWVEKILDDADSIGTSPKMSFPGSGDTNKEIDKRLLRLKNYASLKS